MDEQAEWKVKAEMAQLKPPDVGEVKDLHQKLPYLQTNKKKQSENQKGQKILICNLKYSPSSIRASTDCTIV